MGDASVTHLDLDAVQAKLGLRPAQIVREVRDGRLKSTTVDGKTLFSEADVNAFLAGRDKADEDLIREADEWLERLEDRNEKNSIPAEPVPAVAPEAKASALNADSPAEAKPERALSRAELAAKRRTQVLDALIAQALRKGCTDVYLDPVTAGVRLLHRTAGLAEEYGRFSALLGGGVRDALKAKLGCPVPLAGTHRGGFDFPREGGAVPVRGMVVQTVCGDHVHLDFSGAAHPGGLTDIGYTPVQADSLARLLDGRPGLFITVGPNDPAARQRRMTLATHLAQGSRLVVAIERGVQQKSEILVQLSVSDQPGQEFAAVALAALNMSPNVIFIDEVRGTEETRAALEGVAAGMAVVAHVRAADAVQALLKLIEFGAPKSALARDVLAISAQRVLRRVCPGCRGERSLTDAEAARLGLEPGLAVAQILGCEVCGDGFAGRVCLHDLWVMDAELGKRVAALEPPGDALRQYGSSLPLGIAEAARYAIRERLILPSTAESLIPPPVPPEG